MTIKDAISAAYGAVFEQSNKCALSETAYANNTIPIEHYIEECFLLVYEYAKLGIGEPINDDYGADAARVVVQRHWRQFVKNLPQMKKRILEHEGVSAVSKSAKRVIESRWQEALRMIGYDYGDFNAPPESLASFFSEEIWMQ